MSSYYNIIEILLDTPLYKRGVVVNITRTNVNNNHKLIKENNMIKAADIL